MLYIYLSPNKLSKVIFKKLNGNFILKGVIGGLILGIFGTLLPLTMFSGERQMYLLLGSGVQLGITVLILTSVLKIVLTINCFKLGKNIK